MFKSRPYDCHEVKKDLLRRLLKQMLKVKITLPDLLDALTELILMFSLKANLDIEDVQSCMLEVIEEFKRRKMEQEK